MLSEFHLIFKRKESRESNWISNQKEDISKAQSAIISADIGNFLREVLDYKVEITV